jgi:two-component system, chemotaxis family, protein-glutamate methylesterase/glutaminase
MMNSNNRIIVIGASAGGVKALLRIAAELPDNLPAPIVLVLHIGAHPSKLPDLMTARGPNRAVFARTGTVPAPGTIYVAPPDEHVLLEDGVIRLSRGPKEHHARPAINPLFRSAALDFGPRAVGVILTGMLDDGAAGLQAIKACGGIAVVQDPDDAVEPSMPKSALETVAVDHVVKVDAMADLLNKLAHPAEPVIAMNTPDWLRLEHSISLGRENIQALSTIAVPSAFTCPDCSGALFELNDARPVRFLCHTGHAFSLRSLAVSQELVTEDAMWSGLRSLQEKQAILRRLAADQGTSAPSSAALLAEVERLATVIRHMRGVVGNVPGGEIVGGELEDSLEEE